MTHQPGKYTHITFAVLAVLFFLTPLEALAQISPDLDVQERRAVKAGARQPDKWPHVFPLFGKRVTAKGYDLPLPLGVSLQYYYVTQPVRIEELSLSGNDNPLQPVDFVKFKDADSAVHVMSVRADLWLFPFLNIYGLFTGGLGNTTVDVEEPIELVSSVDFDTIGGGFGMVAAWGVKNFFFSVDTNFVWSNVDIVEDTVFTWVTGLRAGYNFRFKNRMSLGLWAGTMYQYFNNDTKGSIGLADAVGKEPGEVLDEFEDEIASWPPGPDKIAAEQLLAELRERDPGDTVVNYRLDKSPVYPWNLVVGLQWEIDKHWLLRTEAGLIGRWSALFAVNYRFGFTYRKNGK
jgi:hypothetical protein